jgi:glucose/arabinose dehydrogenase
MVGRFFLVLSLLVLIVAGCAAPATPKPSALASVAASSAVSSPTRSPSPVPTATRAASPSAVPIASIVPGSPAASGSPAQLTPGPSSSSAAGDFNPSAVSVSVTPFATGLESPVFATGRRDGSGGLLVIEQPGRIRIVNSDGSFQDRPFLDIGDRLISGGERGLLGLALGPDYEHDGRFYVDYTRKPDGWTVISEFKAANSQADPSSERILLTIPQPFANHNGGMLAFDSEGMLMIGMGDGGSGGDPNGNGQNPQVLLGKLLRIDVNGNPYAIPSDNPFATSTTTAPEIWALGMRNPWRFSFDRLTGDLFIGDVGQDQWEEVDAELALSGGHNYGWNSMEATHCFNPSTGCNQTGLTLPVAEYPHQPDCSITGGYVYRGSAFPILQGGYVFGDYCSGTIRGLSAAQAIGTGSADVAVLASSGLTISSFGQDDAGELYVVDLGNGQVLKLSASAR